MAPVIRLNARILPVAAAGAFVMQLLDPSRAWVILLIGLGGTWLACRWWAHGLARSLQFEREVRFGWAQVGDRLEERFTLTNRFSLPATWVALQDHSTLPGHHASVATGVDGASTSQWKVSTRCTRRGVFTLGGTTLETGDPFGIYTITIEAPGSSVLAVMPPVLPLPAFEILAGGRTGEGRPRRRAWHETTSASHPREMQPGDPVRFIHWKTTARHASSGHDSRSLDRFFVRQFEETPAGDWWIVPDLDEACQLGTGWDATEEHAVILAASLAARGLQDDRPVGMSINGSRAEWILPRRNEYQLHSLLKALAVASPSSISLPDYLQRAGQSLGSHCSLILITANADPRWAASLLPLMRRGIKPTVFLLDQLSFGGLASPQPVSEALQALGVPCHVVPRELLDSPRARPGREGEWEWRISATGKAVALRAADQEWRALE